MFSSLLSISVGQGEKELVLVFGWQGMEVMEGWSGGHRTWWEVEKSMVSARGLKKEGGWPVVSGGEERKKRRRRRGRRRRSWAGVKKKRRKRIKR